MMVTCFSDVLSILLILSTSFILTSKAAGQCSNKFPTGGLAFVAKVAERVTNNEMELKELNSLKHGTTCVQSCDGMADGDYQSCLGCQVYATCSNKILYDNRPCAESNTYWDDRVKQCIYRSTTCPPRTSEVCQLQKVVGFCRASIPRFYFHNDTGQCRSFNYGGCLGNGNKFETYVECATTCMKEPRAFPRGDVCRLQKVVGPCKANAPRFYFHKDTMQCQSFTYGGCKGNGNNFETNAECETTCKKDPPASPRSEVCQLRVATGPCLAYMPRFYFNNVTKQCQSFIYGGCKGNGNNFETTEECETTCMEEP